MHYIFYFLYRFFLYWISMCLHTKFNISITFYPNIKHLISVQIKTKTNFSIGERINIKNTKKQNCFHYLHHKKLNFFKIKTIKQSFLNFLPTQRDWRHRSANERASLPFRSLVSSQLSRVYSLGVILAVSRAFLCVFLVRERCWFQKISSKVFELFSEFLCPWRIIKTKWKCCFGRVVVRHKTFFPVNSTVFIILESFQHCRTCWIFWKLFCKILMFFSSSCYNYIYLFYFF